MRNRLDRADFNGDGRDDILWRNWQTGALSNWLGEGSGGWKINDASAYRVVSYYWEILGVGDFNGLIQRLDYLQFLVVGPGSFLLAGKYHSLVPVLRPLFRPDVPVALG